MVTAQWIMDVPPDLRANVDYIFVLRDNIRVNRERVYKYFAGMFPTFAAFDEVMKQCTQDRECMVIDQGSLSYNISDSVFFYKATPNLKYRICSEEYWEYSARKEREAEQARMYGEGGEESSSDEDNFKPREEPVNVKKRYPTQAPSEPKHERRRKHEKSYSKMYKEHRYGKY